MCLVIIGDIGTASLSLPIEKAQGLFTCVVFCYFFLFELNYSYLLIKIIVLVSVNVFLLTFFALSSFSTADQYKILVEAMISDNRR